MRAGEPTTSMRAGTTKPARMKLPAPTKACSTDDGVVHDDCVDTHEGTAANDAAVKNRRVPDVGFLLESDLPGRKRVQHTIVLHVAARADDDATKVAAQRSTRPYVATRPHDDITDQCRQWMDERGGIDDGNEAIEAVDRHVLASSCRGAC